MAQTEIRPAQCNLGVDWTHTADVGAVDLILSGGDIYPTGDSATAIQIHKADGATVILNVDTTSRRIGVLTAAPVVPLQVYGATAADGLRVTKFNNPARYIDIYAGGAGIINDTTSAGLYIQTGGVTGIRIDTSQKVGIGTTVPVTKLHVDQSSSTAALPVATLDQADVDEPFTKYIGTAAAADLTRSIVDEGDQASETREGWLKVEVEDVGNQIADQDYFIPLYTLSA